MKFRYLNVFALIAIFLISVEIVLEYRALKRGYPAHFLSKLTNDSNAKEKAEKDDFPYRSPRIELSKKSSDVRFWMASASYAEGSQYEINDLFPNVFCAELNKSGKSCQMINAAKSGFAIQDNIRQLKESAVKWKPDYVILYAMSLDIEILSYRYLGRESGVGVGLKVDDKENNKSMDQIIERQIEYTTVYGHMRRYFGGSVLLSSFLHDEVGDKAAISFKKTLEKFIHTCDEIGVKPVLVTFATKFNQSNYREIDYDGKLWMVRYNEHLSPKGWADTVARYNDIIRTTAKERNIIYIDHIEKKIAGQIQYFTDFVHFTKEGHRLAGEALAKGFLDASSSTKNTKP